MVFNRLAAPLLRIRLVCHTSIISIGLACHSSICCSAPGLPLQTEASSMTPNDVDCSVPCCNASYAAHNLFKLATATDLMPEIWHTAEVWGGPHTTHILVIRYLLIPDHTVLETIYVLSAPRLNEHLHPHCSHRLGDEWNRLLYNARMEFSYPVEMHTACHQLSNCEASLLA